MQRGEGGAGTLGKSSQAVLWLPLLPSAQLPEVVLQKWTPRPLLYAEIPKDH